MFNNLFFEKKVLITGHTGFKGTWLTAWLLKLGAKVVGISNELPSSPSMFDELGLAGKITDHREDIRDLARLKAIFLDEKPDFVFHLAAQAIVSKSYLDPIETFSTNVMGTANVLESLRFLDKKCTCVVITSDKCYDNVEWVWGYKETDAMGGKDIYSGSKGAAELVFKSYFHSFFKENKHVRLASARAGNVIGGGDWASDRIVPDCMRAWHRGQSVEIRSPRATRPWQHVLEPLSGYLNLAHDLSQDAGLHGESFNFGPKSENSHTVKTLLEDLAAFWHFEKLDNAYRVTGDVPFHEAGLLKLNCDKALFHLKWLPTLEYPQLIEMTSGWYYDFYKKGAEMWPVTMAQIGQYESLAAQKKLQWAK